MSGWQTHGSRTAYENAWLRVREDDVTRPNGLPGLYGVVEMRHPSVFVVAVTDADEVVLVELFRYTTQSMSLEVPAGGSDGQDPLAAARRELREEAGLEADEWTPLTSMWALNGVCRAPEHVFLARGLHDAQVEGREGNLAAHQAEEGITRVRTVPWPEVLQMVRRGEIDDTGSLASLLCAAIELSWIR